MGDYDKLLEPFKIGKMDIQNRFVMAPMTTEMVDKFFITEEIIDFYEARSKGHAGLITIGSAGVCNLDGTTPKYYNASGAVGAWDDKFNEGWKKMADRIHAAGPSKVAAQLQLNYEWRPDGETELKAYAPSLVNSEGKKIPSGPFVGMPEKEFTVEEIQILVQQYADAAKRIVDAGIDAIEIHAGIGYMVMRFLSKYSNHRTDEYGGSPAGRAKLLCDIIDAIHEKCPGTPIIIRYSIDDFMPGGNRIEDALEQRKVIEAHGIDAWNIQVGFHEAPRPVANYLVPEGEFLPTAHKFTAAVHADPESVCYTDPSVKIPTYFGTRITNVEMCKKMVENQDSDACCLGRTFIADPDFALKVEEGRTEQIRSCIVCSRCLDKTFLGQAIHCSVNGNIKNISMGHPEDKPADKKKHIVIVGAGPGGLETARVADVRGHKVTIIDHSKKIAGLMNMAQVLNPNMENIVRFWNEEMKLHPNIDIRLNTEATPELIKSLNPDEVVLSPGGGIMDLDFPGRNNKMVVSSQEIKDLVAGKVPQGRGFIWWSACQAVKIEGGSPNFMRFGMSMHMMMGKRLVIVGGGFAGLECAGAMYKDREVTVVEESDKLGNGIGIIDRKPEINHLKQLGIRLLENTKVLEVTNQGIRVETTIKDRKTKEVVEVKQELIPCDTVLISVGVQENKKLYDEVVAAMPEIPVHLIGDATTPAGKVYRSLEATNAGYALGMQL